MKLPARIVVCVLPLFVTGCFHRKHTVQSVPLAPAVSSTAPSTPTPQMSTIAPPPPAPIETTKPAATTENSASSATPSNQAPKTPVHHSLKKPSPAHPQIAMNGGAGVSAIGQLSSGDPGASRRQTEESLAATERGLKSLTRPLNDPDQRTAAHIREFLKQARQALASGDVDGAHTLAAKARVLLNELSR